MIVTTRWRDISYEEAMKCTVPPINHERGSRFWDAHRGKLVDIQTPACDGTHDLYACLGPFFQLARTPQICVCAHQIEVGD